MRRANTPNDLFRRDVPADYAWNALAFGLDSSMFSVGMSLLGSTTILPAFISRLTNSPLAVGVASGVMTGGWLLPQLVVAGAVSGLPRKKPVVAWAAWLSRPIFFLVALVVLLYGTRAPTFTLAFVIVSLAVFFVVDSVVSVPWFELLAKTIPPRRRGRVIGVAQVVGGMGGMAVGVGVRYVLSEASPWPFPRNHAILFAAASAVFLVSAVGLSMIREPAGRPQEGPVPGAREVLRRLPGLLRTDASYQRLVMVRVLTGWITIASAFYVLHAGDVGRLAVEDTGLLVSAQVSGSLAAGLLMGVVQDRFGPLAHIRAVITIAGLPAVLVLAFGPILGGLGAGALYIYLVVFFFLGLASSSLGWPFFHYILEYAPEDRRLLYIGSVNTLAALAMLAPPVGGWLVRTFSYTPLFLLALAFAVGALALSARLPSTRGGPVHEAASAPAPAEPEDVARVP